MPRRYAPPSPPRQAPPVRPIHGWRLWAGLLAYCGALALLSWAASFAVEPGVSQ